MPNGIARQLATSARRRERDRWSAPSAASVEMVDAIFNDRRKILPCAAYLEGEYGINGLFVGVPCVLGAGGVEKIVEIDLDDEAQKNFTVSVDAVKELLVACRQIDGSLAEEPVA